MLCRNGYHTPGSGRFQNIRPCSRVQPFTYNCSFHPISLRTACLPASQAVAQIGLCAVLDLVRVRSVFYAKCCDLPIKAKAMSEAMGNEQQIYCRM